MRATVLFAMLVSIIFQKQLLSSETAPVAPDAIQKGTSDTASDEARSTHEGSNERLLVQEAARTASTIISLSSYIVAAVLAVVSIVSGTLGVLYKQKLEALSLEIEQRSQELGDETKRVRAEFSRWREKSEAVFGELAKYSSTMHQLEVQRDVLRNSNGDAELCYPAVTYLGAQGRLEDIVLITDALVRFTEDSELRSAASDAIKSITRRTENAGMVDAFGMREPAATAGDRVDDILADEFL